MQPNNTLNFTRAELLDAVSDKVADRVYRDMQGGAPINGSTNGVHVLNGPKRRGRKPAVVHSRPSEVSVKQILDLIRTRGPLRVAEIMEITGLTQSAAHKKIAELRDTLKKIKEVRDGTMVRYEVARGAGSARRTARKTSRKTGKRTAKKTTGAPAAAAA